MADQQKVAGAIAIHFDEFFGGLHAVSHPPWLDAYREYRAGLETFWSDYPRALSHLERALDKDPGFLLPRVITYIAHRNLGESEKQEPALEQMEREWDRLTPAERLLIEWLRSNSRGRRAQARRLLEDLQTLVPASLFVNHNLVQNAVGVNRPGAAVDAYDRGHFDERTFATASAPYGISSSSTRCTSWASTLASCSGSNWRISMRRETRIFSSSRPGRSWH